MRKFILILLWILFVFILLELAGLAFFMFFDVKPISGYGYPDGMYAEHEVLGYMYTLGFSGVFKGSAYQDVTIDINQYGFRDDAFGTKSPNNTRIAVLGDSVVMGPGVRKEERFTECLQQRYRETRNALEVLNMGINSWTFDHYATLAELNFLDLDPDLVLVGITLNDFAEKENSGTAKRIERHKTQFFVKPLWFSRLQQRMGRTYAARFIHELNTRYEYARMNSDDLEEYHTKWMRSVVRSWNKPGNVLHFKDQLHKFVDHASRQGITYAFVIFPELNDLINTEKFEQPRQIVRTILENNNLKYCDPYDDFKTVEAPDSLFLQHDDVHYNAAGHALLCSAIINCIATNRIPLFSVGQTRMQ